MRQQVRAWWRELGETRADVRPDLQHVRRSGRSLIAEANALFRATEQRLPVAERIVDDRWAQRLVDAHPLVRFISAARHVVPPLARELNRLRNAHCTRHRSLDELVLAAIADGYGQIVIIGAGYDMRASRFAKEADGVRWFEVDEPHTLASKRARLEGLGGAEVESVAANLLVVRLSDALAETPFDSSAPTCWVLEGLLHYLPAAALDALVVDMTVGAAPCRILLSCITPAMAAQASPAFGALVKMVREVPRRYDDRESLAQRFGLQGVALTGYWDFAEQMRDFSPQSQGRDVTVSQDVARLDRGAP